MIAGFAMLGKEAISNKGWYLLHILLWDRKKVILTSFLFLSIESLICIVIHCINQTDVIN